MVSISFFLMHCNLLLLITGSKLLIIKLLIAFNHAVIKFQIQLNRNMKIDISATNIFSIDKWIKQRHLKKKIQYD